MVKIAVLISIHNLRFGLPYKYAFLHNILVVNIFF